MLDFLSNIFVISFAETFVFLLLVLHGEPMDVDHLQLLNPNFGPPNTQPLGMPLEVEPLTQIPIIEPDVNEVQVNWNALPEDENGVEDNDTGSPRPTNGALGLQNGQTRRVTAPTTPTTVLLGHDDEGSYTGSSDGQNDGANNHDSIPALPNSENVINITEGLEQGCTYPNLQYPKLFEL